MIYLALRRTRLTEIPEAFRTGFINGVKTSLFWILQKLTRYQGYTHVCLILVTLAGEYRYTLIHQTWDGPDAVAVVNPFDWFDETVLLPDASFIDVTKRFMTALEVGYATSPWDVVLAWRGLPNHGCSYFVGQLLGIEPNNMYTPTALIEWVSTRIVNHAQNVEAKTTSSSISTSQDK